MRASKTSLALTALALLLVLAALAFWPVLRNVAPRDAVTVASLVSPSSRKEIPDDLAHGEVRIELEADRPDPWGRPFRRKYESEPLEKLAKNVSRSASSSSYSVGPDGVDGSDDDIPTPWVFRRGLLLQTLVWGRAVLVLLAACALWLAWGPGSRAPRGSRQRELLRVALLGGPPAAALGLVAGWLIHSSGSGWTGMPLPLHVSAGLSAALPALTFAAWRRLSARTPPVEEA